MENFKFNCDYQCKHFFGCQTIFSRNKKDAKKGIEIKLKNKHSDYHKSISEECNEKCKLKITNLIKT